MGSPRSCLDSPAYRVSDILGRLGDRWSLNVMIELKDDKRRFGELKRRIDTISQRMLTATLRGLERDGLVSRTVHPDTPPRVDYTLTPMGRSLLDMARTAISWTESHVEEIESARTSYDDDTREARDTFQVPVQGRGVHQRPPQRPEGRCAATSPGSTCPPAGPARSGMPRGR